MRGGRRPRMAGIALGVCACLLLAGIAAAGARRAHEPTTVFAGTTGNDSELVKTLPISRHSGGEKRVVMSLRPSDLPRFRQGDALKISSEFQTTNTCVDHT